LGPKVIVDEKALHRLEKTVLLRIVYRNFAATIIREFRERVDPRDNRRDAGGHNPQQACRCLTSRRIPKVKANIRR
jgi:hypothetical protein